MPRRKKKARELTTEEAMQKMFPNKVVEHVRKEANSDTKATIKKNGSR